jgi:8-oxo-dGTP pyrophosphatase MutT (NUDIX family)
MECDDSLKERIRANLAAFAVRVAHPATRDSAHRGKHRAAAVAITVADEGFGADLPGLPEHRVWSTAAALILTRRATHLNNHPGQWALPGGRVDADESAEATALREMHEEVGLDLAATDVLGRLDDFVTRSGFVMTPVVIWGGPRRTLTRNPDEVDSIHRIPVDEFMRSDAPLLDRTDDHLRPVLRMPVGETSIAAPTAAILYQFREVCVLGRDTRVAHYEQPEFAWR